MINPRVQGVGWLCVYVITHGKKWHVFSLSVHTTHARYSAYVRYFNRTPNVYVAFVYTSIVLQHQRLAINLIVQSKQLLLVGSASIPCRFAVRDRRVLHCNTHQAHAEKIKGKASNPLKKEKIMRVRMRQFTKNVPSGADDPRLGFNLAITRSNSRRRHRGHGEKW